MPASDKLFFPLRQNLGIFYINSVKNRYNFVCAIKTIYPKRANINKNE